MLKMHYQRFSILLFSLWGIYMTFYSFTPVFGSISYMYDSMMSSTVMVGSCVIFDDISLSFSMIVMYISTCVFFFSRYYMSSDPFFNRFMWLLVTFVASMNVLILSGSLFSMLLGWDGLGVSSFALIMYYQNRDSCVSSFLTLLVNRLGDIVIMSSMSVFVMMGSLFLMHYSFLFVHSLFLLLMVAALTKSAQFPFSAWLPAAMAAPTPVSALVHSSTLVTAGVYILIRSCSSNNIPSDVSSMLLFFGSVTSFIGGCCAVFENDLKKLIALSTLSQLGVMMFSLGLGLYNLALLHLFTHAMFKALLFLAAGCILMLSFGVQDLRLLGGISKQNPLLLVFFNVSAFCLMGFPFLSAFYSKHLILGIMWCQKVNVVAVFLMLLSTLFSCIYMVRLLKVLNWGPNHSFCTSTPYPFLCYIPLWLLFFGSCFSGWFFSLKDMFYLLVPFSYSVYDMLLYSITLAGILIGLIFKNSRRREFCSSMFFMTPVWFNINYVTYKFVKTLKCLDSGWLEPNTYGSTVMSISSTYLWKVSMWPMRSFNFVPWLIFMAFLMFVLMWLF